MLREKYTIQKCVSFTEKTADKIQAVADRFNVSFAEVVRECVNNDLDKLIERERKRTTRQKSA